MRVQRFHDFAAAQGIDMPHSGQQPEERTSQAMATAPALQVRFDSAVRSHFESVLRHVWVCWLTRSSSAAGPRRCPAGRMIVLVPTWRGRGRRSRAFRAAPSARRLARPLERVVRWLRRMRRSLNRGADRRRTRCKRWPRQKGRSRLGNARFGNEVHRALAGPDDAAL